MAARILTSTTFKPFLDQSLATDGCGVVLCGDAESVLMLRFHDGSWVVDSYPALRSIDAQDRGESRGFRWRGVWYSDLARCVRRFSAESTRADWDEFYHDVLGVSASWPTLARRRGSVAAELAAAAT